MLDGRKTREGTRGGREPETKEDIGSKEICGVEKLLYK